MYNLPIVLASQSPARLELLQKIKITPARISPANIDESPFPQELPGKLAYRLAFEKAMKIISCTQESVIVIAADTVVSHGRKIFPKAVDNEEVKNCLLGLSGRRHRVHTGICVVKRCDNELTVRRRLVQTIVKFKKLTAQEIDLYCKLGEGVDKAGGCKISGYAESFVSFISGSYSNVMGLPLFELVNTLTSLGYKMHDNQ